jgi:hypothetical protein
MLSDLQGPSVLQLDLFRDVSVRVLRQRIEPTAHGVSWIGVVEGYPESDALFVVVGNHVIGHIYLPFGFFLIESQTNGSYLVQQVDQNAFAGGSDAVVIPWTTASAETDTVRTGSVDDGSVVDLLVVYTQDVLTGAGSESAAHAAIDMAVTQANQALDNSNVRTRIRLVHTASVEYQETGDHSTDLSRLRSTSDGFLDAVHRLRDEHAADLVALITERLDTVCGVAYVSLPVSTGTSGFSVAERNCLRGATLTHEIGHNLGGLHDWYSDDTLGAYPYAHGYVDLGGRLRDVLSTSDHCRDSNTQCIVLLAYSNPVVNHLGSKLGIPVGTSTSCTAKNLENPPCDADLSQAFGHMTPVVARFRDSRLGLGARRLLPGESFRSSSGQFRLTYQSDGDLAFYDEQTRTRLWTANTAGTAPGQALLQTDGNFVVVDAAGVVRWSSGTPGNLNAYLAVQDDGNLVIYGSGGQPIWSQNR